MSLAGQVDAWLLREALGKPKLEDLFHALCRRLTGIGLPIARARLSWPTLHPLFRAEMIKWQLGENTVLEHFQHQDHNTDAWQQSPLRYMLEADLPVLRRRLAGPGQLLDFPLLVELAAEGFTDYVGLSTNFQQPGMFVDLPRAGIIVTWASDRPSGFSDEDLDVLQEIQASLALVCKTVIQAQITENIAETYLGRQAGRNVLEGKIRLGDGAATRALVWFSDMRNSTRLTGSLPSDDFLRLLNDYFECAARPAMEAGGEVLAFIGDAVLVIFPIEAHTDLAALSAAVLDAVDRSFAFRDAANATRREAGQPLIEFGIGLNIGDVVFGNIGVPERLAFTVIGPTVTEVERIEKVTRGMDTNILASAEVAALLPDRWCSIGVQVLNGVDRRMELFVPVPAMGATGEADEAEPARAAAE